MNDGMHCPLCQGGQTSPFCSDRRRSYLRCRECALVFVPAQYRLDRQAEGLEAMRKALALDPDNLDRWQGFAWELHRAGRYEQADSAFEKMTLLAPHDPNVWSTWADSKVSRGAMDEALEIVERAEKMAGENAQGYMTRALAALARGDTVLALQHANAAFDLDPSAPWVSAAVMRGNYYTGRYEDVVRTFRKAEPYLRESENYQNALNLTAMAYNMLGEHALAMDKARAAVALDTLQGYPYTTVAETFAFTGEVDSFYHYMEVAFQKGFKASNINASEPPYKTLAQEPRYRALVERYGLKD